MLQRPRRATLIPLILQQTIIKSIRVDICYTLKPSLMSLFQQQIIRRRLGIMFICQKTLTGVLGLVT